MVKLKSIYIDGFKSFASKTELVFKNNITAIVGPNGSGKSNIVDAVRWVLGEQSIKSLRAGKEAVDVIFAGSEIKSPLKRAIVAITFDNQDHFLNSQLDEVEVKRVIYHTGENEYFINNNKVRLKDITNLFLDSGIGSESLNIISQGSIEQIINAKPIERRVILESASKVLKYKTRKIESLKKLEKTNDNLEKVDLVINELQTNLEPLQNQSEIAKKYLNLENELKELEISLATYDLENYKKELDNLQEENKKLKDEKVNIESTTFNNSGKIEKSRLQMLEIDEKIESLNNEYNQINKQLSEMESQKKLLLERQKYDVDIEKINKVFLEEKEQEKDLQKQINLNNYQLEELRKDKVSKEEKLKKDEEKLKTLQKDINTLESNYQNYTRLIYQLTSEIDSLNNFLEQDGNMPSSVKTIIHHPHLKGIHGTIGQILQIPDEYSLAISLSLNASLNFVVIDNEECAKRAIKYLKENNLGRVTFFPLCTIKGRKVTDEVLEICESVNGFINVASNLVKTDIKYLNIIENQLGNVLVTKDMDSMQILAKKLDYKYRVVSLEGEVSHVGGSLSGGVYKNNSLWSEKEKLKQKKLNKEQTIKKQQETLEKIKKQELEVNLLTNNTNTLKENLFLIINEERIKKEEANKLKTSLDELQLALKRTQAYKTKGIEKEIEKCLNDTLKLESTFEIIKEQIANLKSKKIEHANIIEQEEQNTREKNKELNNILNKIHENEVLINKLEMKMDYLLNLLSENYHMTYEKAKETYSLDMQSEVAREKVTIIKRQMQNFGMVNLGSIEEYERIKSRFDFLVEQKEDLTSSINELQDIIVKMEEKMKERLTTTFKKIEEQFSLVFKKMFKGGRGILKLTDPDNILESGIMIIAEPPGKKLSNISLLSGGEKTLTAISLLFAILNVFPVPFCILDEVEAALDEANVDTFGNYLKQEQNKSEYILITHKKRTMEYADTLYGITMQQQGISKIVSVNLEN